MPFGYDPAGKRGLDAGASTGGFTDVLLRRGAAHVVAVDVGYGLIDWSLRTDERVTVVERVNARALEPEQVGEPVDLVVADLSFIPLGLVLPALVRCAKPDADFLPMVKPQFEVGRENLPSGGVVRDPQARAGAVQGVADQAWAAGAGCARGGRQSAARAERQRRVLPLAAGWCAAAGGRRTSSVLSTRARHDRLCCP